MCFVAFFCSWQFIQGTTQERREWMRIVHTWHLYFMSAGYVRAYQILRRCNCCHIYASNWNYHYIDWLAGNKAAATGTSTVPQSAELKLVTAYRIQMETETDWIELWPGSYIVVQHWLSLTGNISWCEALDHLNMAAIKHFITTATSSWVTEPRAPSLIYPVAIVVVLRYCYCYCYSYSYK